MVPRCSATWRAEYKRVTPSNLGRASHAAVSPISDSNEFMAGIPATSESNDLMAGSCRSYTAVLLVISIPRLCVIQVPSRPDACMYWPARCLVCTRCAVEVEAEQVALPPSLERSGDPDLLPSDPAVCTPGRGEGPRTAPAVTPARATRPDPRRAAWAHRATSLMRCRHSPAATSADSPGRSSWRPAAWRNCPDRVLRHHREERLQVKRHRP